MIKNASLTGSRKKKRQILLLTAISVFLLLFIVLSVINGGIFKRILPKNGVSFVFLSVGQANCTVVCGEAATVVIDTGSNDSEDTLRAAFRYYGIETIDCLVLTHADEDHAGGLDVLLSEYPVACVILTEGTYRALEGTHGKRVLDERLNAGDTALFTASEGDVRSFGEIDLTLLTPPMDDPTLDSGGNEASLVILLEYGETTAIFPGDTDESGELRAVRALSRLRPELRCDLLLVAHHGSSTSTCERFAEYLKPRYAVISCGKNNSYGHPTLEVLDRLENVGAEIRRTDLSGTLIFHSDGKTVREIEQ